MASTEDSELLLHVPLALDVAAGELEALLNGLTVLYSVVQVLDAADPPQSGSEGAESDPREARQLWIEELIIGTPNDLKLRGKGRAILSVLTIAAAILALPKLQAEINKTEAETEKTRVETTAVELELLKKANQLLSEGKISREQHQAIVLSLKTARDSLRMSSGIVRDEISTLSVTDFREQKYMLLLLERARAIGIADPNVNLWIGILTNDASILNSSIQGGADPNVTFEALLETLLPKARDDNRFLEYLVKYLGTLRQGERTGEAEA